MIKKIKRCKCCLTEIIVGHHKGYNKFFCDDECKFLYRKNLLEHKQGELLRATIVRRIPKGKIINIDTERLSMNLKEKDLITIRISTIQSISPFEEKQYIEYLEWERQDEVKK